MNTKLIVWPTVIEVAIILAGVGLQISGFTSRPLAVLLVGLALAVLAWGLIRGFEPSDELDTLRKFQGAAYWLRGRANTVFVVCMATAALAAVATWMWISPSVHQAVYPAKANQSASARSTPPLGSQALGSGNVSVGHDLGQACTNGSSCTQTESGGHDRPK